MEIKLKLTDKKHHELFNIGLLLEVRAVCRTPHDAEDGYVIVEVDEDEFLRFKDDKQYCGAV